MKFLEHPTRYYFFTGKGGVGKTSLSCATAIHLARQGKRVLLVSTDPASNVGQVFEQNIGHRITPIVAISGLSALEIDPKAAAKIYRDRIVNPVRGVLPDDIVRSIEEQLSGACTTEIAAFDEFTSLLTEKSLTANYEHIIFDTAPTGHTIRLLQLPGAWSGFLENNANGANCLGPLSGLEKQRRQYALAVSVLADENVTRLVLVARAQTSSLREVDRTSAELSAVGMRKQFLVINGILPQNEAANDEVARAIWRREQNALEKFPQNLKQLPTDHLSLKPFNLVGVESLSKLFSPQNETFPNANNETRVIPKLPNLKSLIDDLATQDHGLVLLMGKGGVGKTTLAAAIAVALARRGFLVHLSTTDPAAHLHETLSGTMENLVVSVIDASVETERYRRQVLETKAAALDAAGRALLEEDLRSPCTEEIAVFQAFSRVISEAGKKFVIMDTAPTGHTLLLLDATGAYHREVTRHANDEAILTPLQQLQDPQQTKMILVTLPETTPVLEAAALQEDLRRSRIEPWAWIINQSLVRGKTNSALLRRRAENELAQIKTITENHATRLALVPLQHADPVGFEQLANLAGRD